jgi:lipid-binding SYLF domain-containing protein
MTADFGTSLQPLSKESAMMKRIISLLALVALTLPAAAAADDFQDAINLFRKAGESASFFSTSYGYAVFPNVGKGGLGVGGAYGKGRVYEKGRYVGDASMTQLTIGLQAGGQAYSQIIFFQNQAAFHAFTRGAFEFGADASAVAITAGAGAKASTTGASASASATKNDAKTAGQYYKGMATFVIAKGGLMAEASVGGQKFNYKPR